MDLAGLNIPAVNRFVRGFDKVFAIAIKPTLIDNKRYIFLSTCHNLLDCAAIEVVFTEIISDHSYAVEMLLDKN